jgi:hypothetical protein
MKGVCTRLNASLVDAAKSVCAKEDIDFGTLTETQLRGLVCYHCTSCRQFRQLTELCVSKKKTLCGHCKEKVRLYTCSNKYGKMRRSIFNRLLKMGVILSARKNAAT